MNNKDNGKYLNISISKVLIISLSNFLENIRLFKEDAKEIYHQIFPAPSVSKYPRTNELGFIDFFIERLKELLNNSKSLVSMEDQTETFQRNLISLREDYRKFQGHHNDEEIKHLIEEFKDVSYQAEYLIDSYFVGSRMGVNFTDSNLIGCQIGAIVSYYTLGLFSIQEKGQVHKEKTRTT